MVREMESGCIGECGTGGVSQSLRIGLVQDKIKEHKQKKKMARYKNGINGSVSGKVGTVVGASWRGIDYVRSSGDTSKMKWSEAQVNQRILFALVMNWIRPMLSIINIGYQVFKKRKTPLNAAVGYHIKEAVTGDAPAYEIDFSKAIFSVGELLISLVREMVAMGDSVLHINWDNIAESIYSSGNDKATFIVYNPAKAQFVNFVNEVKRNEQEVMLQLPGKFASDRVHVYMLYTSEKGDQVSTSQYLGEITV
jgi:hypothetical protein